MGCVGRLQSLAAGRMFKRNSALGLYVQIAAPGGITIVREFPIFSFVSPSFNQATQVEQMIKSVTNHNYRSVRIEDSCWIGAGATIEGGVTIGHKAVIGAGSMVTHDIPAQSIVVGNPAAVTKIWDPVRCSWHRVEQAPDK